MPAAGRATAAGPLTAVAATSLNKGNANALTVKLDQALKLVGKDDNAGAVEVLTGLRDQVNAFTNNGKLTAEQSAAMLPIIDQLLRQDIADMQAVKVDRTPGFFVNGTPLREFGQAQLKALVEQELEKSATR